MSVRAALVDQLRRYDEAAFVALANRGLLRRATKDLESVTPQVVEDSVEALVVVVGEQRVRFTAQGPATAKCSCPAASVCQHILAAALWLQRDAARETPAVPVHPQETPNVPQPDAADTAALHAALMCFDPPQLAKHAGKPGYRWAWQFVQDLDLERQLRMGGERNVVIGFTHPPVTFRYMGGGLDALIEDAALPKIEKYRVAAVLAYQRAHGAEPAPLETKPQSGSLDLGKDHALAETGESYLRESRARLRAATRQLLLECVDLGLSHLSASIQERFEMLATWAQSADYPRLALMLRRLADHVELLLERAAGADEHRLFDEATIAFGLIEALEVADRGGTAPRHLVGTARNRYEAAPTLELYGLGAFPWRSGSGYVGLTMVFWSPALDGFLTCTDARPETLRSFNPIARYEAAGPWSGLGAPAQATGRRVILSNAQLSANGRVSGNEKTNASVQAVASVDDIVRHLKPIAAWQQLAESRAAERQSLLAEPDPMKDWVALRPTEFGRATFDASRQTLVWPLLDADGARLDAELPYSDFTEQAIKRIEALGNETLSAGSIVIAKVRSRAGQLFADPLSLIRADADAACPVDALHFGAAPAQGLVQSLIAKFRRPGRTALPVPAQSPDGPTPAILRSLREPLLRSAESGAGRRSGLSDLATTLERVRSKGFSLLPSRIDDGAAVRLQLNYACLQLGALLGSSNESELDPG